MERAGSLFGRSIKRITSSHVFLRGVGILSILAFVVVRWGSGGLHSEVDLVPPFERIESICLNCFTNGEVLAVLRVKNLLDCLTGGNPWILIFISINKMVDQLSCCNVVSFLRAIFGEITWTLENWKCFIDPWIIGQLTIWIGKHIFYECATKEDSTKSCHNIHEALNILHCICILSII